MAASSKTWTDNSPPQCNASDLNGFNQEINNLISSAGISLDYNNHNQTAQAVARYAGDGNYFVDSGAANAYVLSVQSPKKSPVAYTEGQIIRFIAQNSNTGASTLNLSSLGLKDIVYPNGDDLIGNEIIATRLVVVYYNGTDCVLITNEAGGYVTPEQFQNSAQIYANDVGAANALIANPSPPYMGLQEGTRIFIKVANTNTSSCTLKLSSLSPVGIKVMTNMGLWDCAGYEMTTGGIYELMWNGSNYQLMNPNEGPSIGVGRMIVQLDATPDPGCLPFSTTPVSRTTYARLFTRIGTTWGAGNGTTTFNLPPPGYVPVGTGWGGYPGLTDAVAQTGGASQHTLTTPELAVHAHGAPPSQAFVLDNAGANDLTGTGPYGIGSSTGNAGGGQPHNNLQPSMVVLFQIKY